MMPNIFSFARSGVKGAVLLHWKVNNMNVMNNAAKMMITAELISLMFFQCSPDVVDQLNVDKPKNKTSGYRKYPRSWKKIQLPWLLQYDLLQRHIHT